MTVEVYSSRRSEARRGQACSPRSAPLLAGTSTGIRSGVLIGERLGWPRSPADSSGGENTTRTSVAAVLPKFLIYKIMYLGSVPASLWEHSDVGLCLLVTEASGLGKLTPTNHHGSEPCGGGDAMTPLQVATAVQASGERARSKP